MVLEAASQMSGAYCPQLRGWSRRVVFSLLFSLMVIGKLSAEASKSVAIRLALIAAGCICRRPGVTWYRSTSLSTKGTR